MASTCHLSIPYMRFVVLLANALGRRLFVVASVIAVRGLAASQEPGRLE